MRDQYAGDVSDVLKYALLRELAASGRRLGVAWYYNPTPDGRNDGRHTEYLMEGKWLSLDRPLITALRALSERSVGAVERLPIWPDATRFHRAPVPGRRSRNDWARTMTSSLEGTGIVFLDPDNGLGGCSPRHATLEEVKSLRRPGERTIVLIKFPGRVPFDQQQASFHESLRTGTGADRIRTIRTSVTVPTANGGVVPRLRWFTLIDCDDLLAARLGRFADRVNAIPGARATIAGWAQPESLPQLEVPQEF